MIPLDSKKAASVIIGSFGDKRGGDTMHEASEHIMSALKNGSASELSEALCAFLDHYESQEEDSQNEGE